MKNICCRWALVLLLTLSLCACGGGTEQSSWQEQYDLGVRYLSQGNYEEAVIAFTAAIEIDPKQVDAYIGLAQAYTAQGDAQRALEILAQAEEACGPSEALTQAVQELGGSEEVPPEGGEENASQETPTAARTERIELEDGRYIIAECDDKGQWIHETEYNADGDVTAEHWATRDDQGRMIQLQQTFLVSEESFTFRFSYPQSGTIAAVSVAWQIGSNSGTVDLEYAMTDSANQLDRGATGSGESGLIEVEIRELDIQGGVVSRMKYDGQGNPLPQES